MRRWLLACVGILLVTDGYWASQNLVLKSADEGIYWFAFSPDDGVLEIELYEDNRLGFAGKAKPRVTWINGQWYNDGLLVSDVARYIEYVDGPHTPCGLSYTLPENVTIETAILSIEEAFRSGAGDVIILAPLPNVKGQFQKPVSAFEAPTQERRACPFSNQWRATLSYGDSAYGYPPNVKAAKKAN